MGKFYQKEGGGSGKRDMGKKEKAESRSEQRKKMVLLQYVDEWTSSGWSVEGSC